MLKTFFLNSTLADYGEEEFNYIQKFLLQQGILNTQGADYNDFIDLQVVQHGAGDMSVDVKIGTAVIDTTRSSVNFKVFVSNLALANLVITPNTSGLDRVDAVILKLSQTTEPNALMNNVATLEVVPGDGATALSDGDIQTAIGATYDFIRLADITVSDGETAILTADIADTRVRCYNTDATVPNPTIIKFRQLSADPATPLEGEMWYNTTDNMLRYFDGALVINIQASVYTGGNGIDVTAGVISVDLNDHNIFIDPNNIPAVFTDDAGKVITLASDGLIPIHLNSSLEKYIASASDNLKLYSDAESTKYSTGFGRVKAILVLYYGVYRIKYDYGSVDNGYSTSFKIYKNGVDTGVGGASTSSSTYQTTGAIDITLKPGDIIEVYAQSNVEFRNAKVRNFRLYFDKTKFSGSGVVIQ